MAISIQIRRDTADNWTANSSVILAEGEIAATINQTGLINDFKIGNGVSAWGELPYIQTGSTYTDTDISSIINNIAVISNNIDVIETNINTHSTDINELDDLIDSISNNITTLTEGISDNNTNIETLSTGLQNLTTTVSDIRDSAIPSINTELESLTTAVNVLAEASSNLVSLDEVNQAIENSISSLPTSSEIQYLSSEISSDISNLTRINGEITTKINALSSDISSINTITVQYLSSTISSKVSEADVENIISSKADKTTVDTISSYVYGNISTAIDELSLNSLTNSDIINGNNVKIGDNSLSSILSSKLDKDTPFNVTELSVGNLIISGNTISTEGKTYTFVSGESNTIATLEDVTTISTNASKLSGITITPANISDPTTVPPADVGYTDDTVWSISKDGEEEYNTLWAKLDYYNGSYQPTRLPSYNEVRTYVASEINSHNTNEDSHQSIISSINTISSAVSDHYTYIDESFNDLSGYIGRISSDIRGLSSHYSESNEKFSTITSNISDISSITITVPNLSTTIETVSSDLDDKITQLASINATEHDVLADNFSDLSSDLDYIKYRVVALDEARWIPLSSDSVALDGNITSFDEDVFGFYFSPKDVLVVPESINNVSLKTLSINTTAGSELSALDIIATAHIYDNNVFREIGRSLNSINISTANEYIFTFHNCIASIDSVVYIEFKNYATGEIITKELPLVLHTNDNDKIGVITSLADRTTGSSDVFPTTDIVIDYVADVVVEIDNIKAETNEIKNDTVSVFNEVTSILSADNIVIAPSANIQALNSEELSTFVVSSNPRILTTTKLYGNTPEDTVSCFPYTSTDEVLLKDEIYVTGTPGIGQVSSNVTLHTGDNITNILSNMFRKPLDIEVIQPSASFLLEDISSNTIYEQGKTYFYEFGKDLQLSAVVEYTDGKYISDPYSPSGTVNANTQPTIYSIGWGNNSSMVNTIQVGNGKSNIIAPNNFKFTASTDELYIGAKVEHTRGNNPPVNNFNETVVSASISANLIKTPYIHLRPAGYGYIGIDNVSSTTITSAEVVNNTNTIYRMPDNLEIKKGSTAEINIPAGTTFRRFIIAYPSALGELSELSASAVEIDGINYTPNFEKHELDFRGATTARDRNPIMQYYVYTYASPIYWNGPIKFKVTI